MTIALLWLAAACGYWIVATRAVNRLGDARASEGSPAESTWRPTVVLARPLRGAPRYLRPCLASLLEAAARADAGVCLGLASRDDPAAAVAEELRRGSRAAVEIRSDPLPPGENRKIANLVQALAGSNAEVVVLSDADILVPPDYVPTVIAPLADASVGLTTCPYRSVPARTVLSRIDALLTNTRFLPSTCLAIRAEGLHFALGATIAVRRDALESAGGLSRLLDEPADDHALARNVEQAGYRLAWVPRLVEHHLADEPAGRVLRRQLRWLAVIRRARPLGYLGLMLAHGLLPALWLAGLVGFDHGRWIVGGWWGVQMWLVWRSRAILGVQAQDLALLPVADVLAALLYVAAWFSRARPPD